MPEATEESCEEAPEESAEEEAEELEEEAEEKPQSPRAIVFDLHGTLVEAAGLIIEMYRQAAEEKGIELPSKAELIERYSESSYVQALMDIGLTESEAEIAIERFDTKLQRDPDSYTKFVYVKPGAVESLHAAKQGKKALAVHSNGHRGEVEVIVKKLTDTYNREYDTGYNTSTMPLFWTVLSARDVSGAKPNPEGLDSMAWNMWLKKPDIMMVDDSNSGKIAAEISGTRFYKIDHENTLKDLEYRLAS